MKGSLFPTARLLIETRDGEAFEYVWNRGDGEGLQFEGDISYATSKEGVDGMLTLRIFNVPRTTEGEAAPLKNALVTLEAGYIETGTWPIFRGYLKTANGSMEGATSVWTIHANIHTKRAASTPLTWTPPARNSNGQTEGTVNLATVLEGFAAFAGISVIIPPSVREVYVTPTTFQGTAMEILQLVIETMRRRTGRKFYLIPSLSDKENLLTIVDPLDGIPILVIDSEEESVYDAGFEVVQKTDELTENDSTTQNQELPTNDLRMTDGEEESFTLFYKMDLPLRGEIQLGMLVETTDPRSGVRVRFAVTSITETVGSNWGMSIRGPVDDAESLRTLLPGVIF